MGLNLLQKIALYSTFVATALIGGCYDSRLQSKTQIKSTLETRIKYLKIDSKERKKYAVLLNGDTSNLHRYNIAHAYSTLKSLGFEEESIFILSSNYPRPKSSEKNLLTITTRGSKENFISVVNHLSKIGDNNDTFIFYGTGHGSIWKDQSWISLYGKDLSASDFRNLIEKINSKMTVVVMDQCFSGGFSKELKNSSKNIITISNTDEKHTTYCKYFSEEFWNSFFNSKADLNKDGDVSVKEAYIKAMTKHKEKLADRLDETNGKYICTGKGLDVSLK